uniref:Sorting nexin-2 n=1 Tax=Sinocyclocheilus grahami TaxID=75366 RepID=A0A672R1P4_SINGR
MKRFYHETRSPDRLRRTLGVSEVDPAAVEDVGGEGPRSAGGGGRSVRQRDGGETKLRATPNIRGVFPSDSDRFDRIDHSFLCICAHMSILIVINFFVFLGDGMNAYMVYKVLTKTSLSIFSRDEVCVKRRFSDFLGLHSKLASKYMHMGYIVPPAPEKSIVGMTKVKVGKEDLSSVEFVEKRRSALERYLLRTVKHPALLKDPDVLQFLESSELPRAVSTQALSGAGILRMVNKAADAVNKMTIKMNESDAWFEEKQQQFDNLDVQLRKLHASVESLVCHRRELSVNTASFAKSAAMLGNSEDHTALSRALSQLAEVEEKIDQLHQDQACADFYLISELLGDYVRLITAVKGVFDQRMKTWAKCQDAQVMLQRKREAEAKLQHANKPDKLQQAKDEIREWEGKVQQGERDFEQISKNIRREVGRFEKDRVKDFRVVIIKYLESLVHTQQQLIKYWEAFLPEAKAIA